MKKYIVLSVIFGILSLSGCSDRTKEKVKEAASSASEDTAAVVQEAKEKSSSVMEEAKRQAGEALEHLREKSKKAVKTAGEKGEALKQEAKAVGIHAAESVEKKAVQIKEKLSSAKTATAPDGKALYSKCAGCHGVDGRTKALGKAPAIAGQSSVDLVRMLKGYRAGSRNAYGMGGVMHTQAAGLSDAEIKALAGYISALK